MPKGTGGLNPEGRMGKWKKVNRRRREGEQRESNLAKASVLALLVNGFIWAGLRGVDILVLSLASVLVAGLGLLLAKLSQRLLRKRHGRLGGESLSLIGYWGNLLIFVLSFLLFSYSLAIAVMRGEIL